jgi:hypothetical protein
MKQGQINSYWTLTHSYDNCLSSDLLEKVNTLINRFSEISREEKLNAFVYLRREIIHDITALKFYDKMIDDFIQNTNNNYDPVNNIDTIALLYMVYLIYVDNPNIIPLLVEQLKDMKTGFCPQGRTVRLVQLIQPYL